jgi:hypothetical protein
MKSFTENDTHLSSEDMLNQVSSVYSKYQLPTNPNSQRSGVITLPEAIYSLRNLGAQRTNSSRVVATEQSRNDSSSIPIL